MMFLLPLRKKMRGVRDRFLLGWPIRAERAPNWIRCDRFDECEPRPYARVQVAVSGILTSSPTPTMYS